jgi:hypothetical protein
VEGLNTMKTKLNKGEEDDRIREAARKKTG